MVLTFALLLACGVSGSEPAYRSWTGGAACSTEFFRVFEDEQPELDPTAIFSAGTAEADGMTGDLRPAGGVQADGLVTLAVTAEAPLELVLEGSFGGAAPVEGEAAVALSGDSYWCEDGTLVAWTEVDAPLSQGPLLIIGHGRTASSGEPWWYQGQDMPADGPSTQVVDAWFLEGRYDPAASLEVHLGLLDTLAEADLCRAW